eukprot:2906395-Amphidinium_carterae.1
MAFCRGVLVLNGVDSFHACATKVAQHALLHKAGLASPKSVCLSQINTKTKSNCGNYQMQTCHFTAQARPPLHSSFNSLMVEGGGVRRCK